ncbi:MAG: hypothetical protein QG635_2301 [Bacteroidota bacterium]|nr:hypothetical protein [Bacteroidota bacterium]
MMRLLSSLVLFFMVAGSLLAQPKIEIVGGDTYDWGKVKPNQSPLSAKIKLTNTGTEKLVISEVKPGCGCTTAPIDKKELEKGDTANLDVKLNLGAGSGIITKSITISSNDPQQEKKILFLKANIIREVSVNPMFFTFGEMKVGSEFTSAVKVKNESQQEVTISGFKVTPENLVINLSSPKTLKPGEEVEVIAKAKPENKGYFNCSVSMKTTHPDYPEVTVTGYGNVAESPIFNNTEKHQ